SGNASARGIAGSDLSGRAADARAIRCRAHCAPAGHLRVERSRGRLERARRQCVRRMELRRSLAEERHAVRLRTRLFLLVGGVVSVAVTLVTWTVSTGA